MYNRAPATQLAIQTTQNMYNPHGKKAKTSRFMYVSAIKHVLNFLLKTLHKFSLLHILCSNLASQCSVKCFVVNTLNMTVTCANQPAP